MHDVTLVILNSLRIKCRIRRPLKSVPICTKLRSTRTRAACAKLARRLRSDLQSDLQSDVTGKKRRQHMNRMPLQTRGRRRLITCIECRCMFFYKAALASTTIVIYISAHFFAARARACRDVHASRKVFTAAGRIEDVDRRFFFS